MNSDQIADAYDAVADEYLSVRSADAGLGFAQRLYRLVGAGGRVLDAGCGPGVPLARYMVERGMRIHGIDLSPRMIELARHHVPQARFELADMGAWSPDGVYDGILAWDSFFHLRPALHEDVLGAFHAALADDGVLLVTVGGVDGELRSCMLGREFYYGSLSREAYTEALTRIGFTLLGFEHDQPGDHCVIIARKRPAASGGE